MFGFGKVPCVLCDRTVSRKEALAVRDRKEVTVCRQCFERWQARGGTCPECGTPLRGAQEPGIFIDSNRSFGHADCGGVRLIAA